MPITTVAAIITRQEPQETHILLTLRNIPPFKGHWCLPGGHIDNNERARDAVTREVQEEVGLQFDPHFFDYFDEIIEPDIHSIVLAFDGTFSGDLAPDPGEVAETGWFEASAAMTMPLAFEHNAVLASYFLRRGESREEIRDELLAEYSALRSEVISLLDKRYQILVYTLTAAGAFIGIGAGELVPPVAILIYPIFSIFLLETWAHTDLRIGQIGDYIRENVESKLPGFKWEGYLRRLYLNPQSSPFKNLVENYAIGLFVSTQILAILVALAGQFSQFSQGQSTPELLLNLTLSVILLTAYFLFGLPRVKSIAEMRRKRYSIK